MRKIDNLSVEETQEFLDYLVMTELGMEFPTPDELELDLADEFRDCDLDPYPWDEDDCELELEPWTDEDIESPDFNYHDREYSDDE